MARNGSALAARPMRPAAALLRSPRASPAPSRSSLTPSAAGAARLVCRRATATSRGAARPIPTPCSSARSCSSRPRRRASPSDSSRFLDRFPTPKRWRRRRPPPSLAEWSGLGTTGAPSPCSAAAIASPRRLAARRRRPASACPGSARTRRARSHRSRSAYPSAWSTPTCAAGCCAASAAPTSRAAPGPGRCASPRPAQGDEVAAWTHASMEFGAAVCRARAPRCERLPDRRAARRVARPPAVPVPRQAPCAAPTAPIAAPCVRLLAAAPGHRAQRARALRARLARRRDRIGPALDDAGWERIVAALERDGLAHRARRRRAAGRRYNRP